MALGFPNSNGGRTTDSALFHALGNAFVGSWISGFRVRQASPVGMNVLIGGENGIPDDLLVRDAMSATFPVSNLSTQPVQASVTMANSANPRIDAVVIYIDTNVAASQAVANNENRTKAVVVPGTPATNPSAPTPSQIKAKIGASNPYEIIAEIRVNAGTTTIIDAVITDRRNPATLADGRINRSEMFGKGVVKSDALDDDAVSPRSLAPAFRDYSTSEENTGKKWIDDRAIYRKVIRGRINIVAHANIFFDHGITGLTDAFEIVSIRGSVALGGKLGTTPQKSLIPHIEDNQRLGLSLITKTQLRFISSYPWGESEFSVILEYVK
jgi:hypothetical protein